MTIIEHATWLHGEGFDMLGIVTLPPAEKPVQGTGVVIVVGGAQYRAGSHRQFVQLARFLAEAGFPVLRFDLPGMGDSPGVLPSFENTAPHIAAAIAGFQRHCPAVQRVVLWGLCDGASASLLYVDATRDQRIVGLALLNPWVRSEVSLARARVKHYYWQRLGEPDFWRKLLRGGVGWGALRKLGQNIQSARDRGSAPTDFQDRMARGWLAFGKPILLLRSERDLTAQEFVEHANAGARWQDWATKSALSNVSIEQADHTCSTPSSRQAVEQETLTWLSKV